MKGLTKGVAGVIFDLDGVLLRSVAGIRAAKDTGCFVSAITTLHAASELPCAGAEAESVLTQPRTPLTWSSICEP